MAPDELLQLAGSQWLPGSRPQLLKHGALDVAPNRRLATGHRRTGSLVSSAGVENRVELTMQRCEFLFQLDDPTGYRKHPFTPLR